MMKKIVKAVPADFGRIAEIIVYNNRINYYPIFQDITYSFGEYNVMDVRSQFLSDPDMANHTYVYRDQVIKGFVSVSDHEIQKLYVDSFFQNEGIGHELIQFAVEKLGAEHLWVLEKNTGAVRFYQKHGFTYSGEKKYEEDTTEYLLHMVR